MGDFHPHGPLRDLSTQSARSGRTFVSTYLNTFSTTISVLATVNVSCIMYHVSLFFSAEGEFYNVIPH